MSYGLTDELDLHASDYESALGSEGIDDDPALDTEREDDEQEATMPSDGGACYPWGTGWSVRRTLP